MNPDELRRVYRMDPLPNLENPQETLRDYLDKFLTEKPEALIYVLKDSGLFVVTDNNSKD